MARGNTWTNSDGLIVGFASRDTVNSEPAIVHTVGRVKQVEMQIDFSNHADAAAGTLTGKEAVIPAGARIISAITTTGAVVVGPTANTGLDVGLKTAAAGVAIDADGLVSTFALTAGAVQTGGGALVGTVLAANSVLSVAVDSAMTAGDFSVLVEYADPIEDQTPPSVITGAI